jgi:hypothetical protein
MPPLATEKVDVERSRNSANSGIGSIWAWGTRMVLFIHHDTPEQTTNSVVLKVVDCDPTSEQSLLM